MKWRGRVPECSECVKFLMHLVHNVQAVSVDHVIEDEARTRELVERYHRRHPPVEEMSE